MIREMWIGLDLAVAESPALFSNHNAHSSEMSSNWKKKYRGLVLSQKQTIYLS